MIIQRRPFWMEEAVKYDGMKEVPGKAQNPMLARLLDVMDGRLDTQATITDDEAYCAACLSGIFEMVGVQSPRTVRAREFLNWGVECAPAVGAVVVFSRTGGGHVGLVSGRDYAGRYVVFGFNQRNMVCHAPFSADRVLGFRWPRGFALPPVTGFYNLPLMDDTGRVSTNER